MDMKHSSFEVAPIRFDQAQINRLGRITERYSRFQAPFSERRLLLVLGDTLAIAAAVLLTYLLWDVLLYRGIETPLGRNTAWYVLPPLVVGWYMLGSINDLYHIPSSYSRTAAVRRIFLTTILAAIIYLGASLIFSDLLPIDYFLKLSLFFVPLVVLWRCTYTVVFKLAKFRQRVLLIGNGSRADAIVDALEGETNLNYDIVGYVPEKSDDRGTDIPTVPYMGAPEQLSAVVEAFRINEIVVAIDDTLEGKLFERLIECQANGVRVNWMPDLYQRLCRRVPVEHIDPGWALYMMQDRPVFNRLELAFKRLLDLTIGLLSLPALVLLIAPIAVAIKLESPGPIFYSQTRCGRAGALYKIYKFRTMVADAEKDGKARWARKRDPRITRIGHFLRKARLDELPQVINVLRGEMSMIGPRPERPEFVGELEEEIPFYRLRLLVKPGITGWAQVNYDYGNTIDDALVKLQYDFYYVRYWSIWLDLYILFKTLGVVFKLKGT